MSRYIAQDLGTRRTDAGIKFRVWAQHADDVKLVLARNGSATTHSMASESNGYWSTVVADAEHGDKYVYSLDGVEKSDPRGRNMEHSAG
jgi:1,4-alpha-glucan branching enzyme